MARSDARLTATATRAREPVSRWSDALWPALAMFVIGLVDLGRPQLWTDELATWSAASRPVAQLWSLAGTIDGVITPYYLFMHFWIGAFGDSVVALRIPSLLAATATTAVVTVIAARLFTRRAGIFAGVVFALLPMVSRMAQEARPYAIAMLLTALSTLLFLRALDDPGWRRWAGYAVSVTAVGAIHLVALAILVGHAAAAWWWHRDRRVARFGVAAVVGVIPLVPLAVLGLHQQAQQIGWIPQPSLILFIGAWPMLFRSIAVACVVLVLAALAWFTSRRRPACWFLTGMVFLPTIAVFLVSLGTVSYMMPRYLLFVLPPLAILAGATLAAVRIPLAAVVVAALAAAGFPDQLDARNPGSHNDVVYPFPNPLAEQPGQYADYAALTDLITHETRSGDAIVYADRRNLWLVDTGVDYQLRGQAQPRDVFRTRTAAEVGDLWARETTDYAAALGRSDRVWVVAVGERSDPFAGSPAIPIKPMEPAKAEALRARFAVTRVSNPPGFTVALLTRR